MRNSSRPAPSKLSKEIPPTPVANVFPAVYEKIVCCLGSRQVSNQEGVEEDTIRKDSREGVLVHFTQAAIHHSVLSKHWFVGV